MENNGRSRKFWRILCKIWFVMLIPLFLVNFSMYWWPDMPSSPRPTEGRIYPLNNHGHNTYMNEREHLFEEVFWPVWMFSIASLIAIDFLIDPFDRKRRERPMLPPPPWSQM
jgi:hypothetical protein